MSVLHRRFGALALGLLTACGGGGGGAGGNANHVQPPSSLSYPSDPSIYVVDVAAAPNLPSFSGGVDLFSVDPPLPAGLALDPSSGAISGTPAAPEPRTVHTVTARNSGGAAHFPLRISVVAPPRFAYTFGDDSTLAIFSADALTGRLHRRGYLPATSGESGPEKMIVHPSFKFAYVSNSSSNNISVYTIDPAGGWLTPGSPAPTGSGPHQMVIDSAGRFVYVSNRNSDQIRVYSVNALTGALTPLGSPVATGTQPSALALDTTGRFLFVTLRGDAVTGAGSGLSVFDVDAQSGSLSTGGAALSLGSSKPVGLAVDPQRNQVYVTEEAAKNVVVVGFDAMSGSLSVVGIQSLASQPSAVAAHPTGKFAYVAGFDASTHAGSVSIFTIDAASGGLVPAGSASAGLRPSCITFDPSGHFAYVTGHDSSDVAQYAIDAETGALAPADDVMTRIGPSGLAIAQGPHVQTWVPRFVHVSNSGSDDISAFRIDPSSGVLTEVGPTTPAGTMPVSLATDPRQRFLYVADKASIDIGIYQLSPSTGALFEVTPKLSVAGHPTHVTVDPSGRFVYLTVEGPVDPNSGSLITFSVHPTLGTLSEIDAQMLGARPTWVTTDPTGQYLYVANSGNGQAGTGAVASFRLPAATGIPVSVGTSAAPGLNALGFHPNGKYMYAILKHSNAMVEFTIDASDGTLTLFPGIVRAGLEPVSIAVTPDGRFAFVAFSNSIDIGHTAMLPIDPATGFLIAPASPAEDGLHPVDLGVDPSGRFLYVANSGSNDVSLMTIDPLTGMLGIQPPTACGLTPSAVLVTGVTQ